MAQNQIGYLSREEIITEIQLRLADGMVDVELDREHYDIAINKAISIYRQLSSNSVEESIIFFNTENGVNDYVMPDEVMEVQRMYRRGIGSNGSGSNFDPFDVAFNNMYMLQAGSIGGLVVFDAFSQYKETISRIFGGEYNFIWNRNSHVLKVLRNIKNIEEIAVGVHNFVPESILLRDLYASPWLSDMSLAQSKLMLGEARGKYTTGLPGAGGAVILNGENLKTDAKVEIEELRMQIQNKEEGSAPLGFVIG